MTAAGSGPRRLRVAMVSTRYAPLLGGVEAHVAEVAPRLAERGVETTVLTVHPGGVTPRQEHDGLLEVRRFPAWPGPADFQVPPALVHDVTHNGYDLVHVQGMHAALPPVTLAAAVHARLPTVATFHTGGHSSHLRQSLRAAQWWALAPVLRRADALVAVCRYEVERFMPLVRDPKAIHLIANGADPLPVDGTPTSFEGDPLVVSVGRLERYKGHHRVIAAMPALRRIAPGARLVVVGRGPYEHALRRLVLKLGLADCVTFTSFDLADRSRLGALLVASDVVALLSDYEAHPIAVMEALGLGKKVLVADTSGLSELSRFDLVTTVDRHADPATIGRRLAELAAGPEVEAPALPTWDDCATALLALYEEVVNRRRTPA